MTSGIGPPWASGHPLLAAAWTGAGRLDRSATGFPRCGAVPCPNGLASALDIMSFGGMAAPEHETEHLLSLIEAARACAERLGAGEVVRHLAEAAAQGRAIGAAGDRSVEGVPPQDLTTANDL